MDRFQNTRQPDWDWWGKLWPTPGATLRRLGITSDRTLAEVPCGNGYFALPAARIIEPSPVYALDLDQSLLDDLAHIAEQNGIENIVPMHGDARELAQHIPEPVDTVLMANTFPGVEDKAGFVHQAFASLQSGGQLVIVNWDNLPRETTRVGGLPRGPPTDLRMSQDETETIVTDGSDFGLKERVELSPYHYARVFER